MLSGSNVVIDAGLTAWKTRVRKLQGVHGLQTINIEALKEQIKIDIKKAKIFLEDYDRR